MLAGARPPCPAGLIIDVAEAEPVASLVLGTRLCPPECVGVTSGDGCLHGQPPGLVVTWSAEDGEYVVTCLELPSLSLAGSLPAGGADWPE